MTRTGNETKRRGCTNHGKLQIMYELGLNQNNDFRTSVKEEVEEAN